MNTTINYPEMWSESKSELQAEYSSVLKKYRVTSLNKIEEKRGIEYIGIVSDFGANDTPNKRKGWYKYYMTKRAFDLFTETSDVEINCLLD